MRKGQGVVPFTPDKHRARAARNGRMYNDPRNRTQEAAIAAAYEGPKFAGAVRVDVYVNAPMPESRPKRALSEKFAFKPDADNIAKSVLDGLTGTAYDDDRQVVELHVWKNDRMRGLGESTCFEVREV